MVEVPTVGLRQGSRGRQWQALLPAALQAGPVCPAPTLSTLVTTLSPLQKCISLEAIRFLQKWKSAEQNRPWLQAVPFRALGPSEVCVLQNALPGPRRSKGPRDVETQAPAGQPGLGFKLGGACPQPVCVPCGV